MSNQMTGLQLLDLTLLKRERERNFFPEQNGGKSAYFFNSIPHLIIE